MDRIKPSGIVRIFFPKVTWRIKTKEKKLFITFDDGPVPEITPWVIDCLKSYNAVATFFCVGENVQKYPKIFNQLTENGMSVGNHSFSHINPNPKDKKKYFQDVDKCSEYAKFALFRPPYGKIFPSWVSELKKRFDKVVMWDILSLDFDKNIMPEEVVSIVNSHIRPGSIIVFHDSLKAWDRLKYALPKVLEYAKNKGYEFGKISD